MPNNNPEISLDVLKKAAACKTPEELVVLAKSEGVAISSKEAEAYLAEFEDVELDSALLEKVAGGWDFSGPLAEKCDVYCPHV